MDSAPVQRPSNARRFLAIGLSIVTLLCAGLYWLVYLFVTAQVYAGVYGGPELLIVGTILTLPPAAICTIVAMILVGPRRCKTAWISLSSFGLPYLLLFLGIMWSLITKALR
jgi:hypothetical protein